MPNKMKNRFKIKDFFEETRIIILTKDHFSKI